MTGDADKPIVALEVMGGDADALREVVENEQIEVHGVSEQQPAGGFAGALLWIINMILAGVAWDLAKFIATRGAKGMKRLVEKLHKKSGRRPDEEGTVVIRDAANTTVNLKTNMPDAAYTALEKLRWRDLVGQSLSWYDPPGVWRVDEASKFAGDDSH